METIVPQSPGEFQSISSIEGEYVPYPSYSFLYIIKHYRCGCASIVPMLRSAYERDYPMHAREDARDIQDNTHNCPACNEWAMRALQRKLERRVGA